MTTQRKGLRARASAKPAHRGAPGGVLAYHTIRCTRPCTTLKPPTFPRHTCRSDHTCPRDRRRWRHLTGLTLCAQGPAPSESPLSRHSPPLLPAVSRSGPTAGVGKPMGLHLKKSRDGNVPRAFTVQECTIFLQSFPRPETKSMVKSDLMLPRGQGRPRAASGWATA